MLLRVSETLSPSASLLLLGFVFVLFDFLVVPSITFFDKWLDSLIISGSSLLLGLTLFFSPFFLISTTTFFDKWLSVKLSLSASSLLLGL